MTLQLGRIWHTINQWLTTINIFLFAIISFGPIPDKKQRDEIRIPLIANIILLAFLVLAVIAIYKIYLQPSGSRSEFTV